MAHEVSAGTGELAWIAVSVPSATRLDAAYTVRYDAATDLASCSCVAAGHGQPCFHAGVAGDYGRGAVKSYQEARRLAGRQAAWEGNEAALGPSL